MSHPLLSIQDVSLSFAGVKARSVSLEVNEVAGRHHRAQWSRQDLAVQLHLGCLSATIGQHHLGWGCFDGDGRMTLPSPSLECFRIWRSSPPDGAGEPLTWSPLPIRVPLVAIFCSSRTRAEEVRHRAFVEEIIDFLNLEVYRKTPVGILPYGVLKRVESGGPVHGPNSSSSMNPRRVSIRRRLKIWPATCWISRNSEESLKF